MRCMACWFATRLIAHSLSTLLGSPAVTGKGYSSPFTHQLSGEANLPVINYV